MCEKCHELRARPIFLNTRLPHMRETTALIRSILSSVIASCSYRWLGAKVRFVVNQLFPLVSTRSYYDRGNNPSHSLAALGSLLLVTAFMLSSFWWSQDEFFLLLSALLVPVFLLGLPRVVRGTYLACMGEPALRINETGFWARSWSSLGMISWRDVASVEIETGKIHQLVVHLHNNAFARLAGHDQVSIMLARLAGFIFFIDAGPNALRLISSSELKGSWEEFVSTLDPILAAHGIRRLNKAVSR